MNDTGNAPDLFKTLDLYVGLEIAAIVLLTAMLIVGQQRLLTWVANRLHGKRRLHMLSMVPVLRLLLIFGAIYLVVPLLIQPSLQNMVALMGTVGLAVGFALKDLASSLIAGLLVVGERPFRTGDWIEVGGTYGEVRHIGMRTVQLLTKDDNLVCIPHSRLWTESISNSNDGNPRLQCVAEFFLHPSHDARLVKQVLSDVALTSAYLYFDDPINVVVQEKPWGTHYRIKAYPIDCRQQVRFVSDMTVRGKEALARARIGFAAAPFAVSAE